MKESGVFSFLKVSMYGDNISIGKLSISTQAMYNFVWIIIKVIFILIVMYLIVKLGNKIINRYVSRQKDFRISLNDKRAKTIGAILKSVLRYSVYFFGIFTIITVISPKVGVTGLTFAGIGGVAVGLGAQSIIKDIINGFFILFEDQFSVGDYISIDDKSGIVESMELRVTKVRDFNGDLHIIPNGLISKVTNHSKGSIRITVDVEISYDEDIQKVIEIMTQLCENFAKENSSITQAPTVQGITNIKDNRVTIRVAGKAKAMTQWDMEMKLRREIGETLKKENIKTPYLVIKNLKGE
ncbi:MULTISPECIES: mechanosensitive ion channel family protein [Clostridium]|uniref:MscS family protein YkuT n=3 Tax=Clostridium TaxID=1485 RepID=D8GJY0_CLOLD|nr:MULTISPECIES: mechanosensitive ion channel family protein [Clostridium]ADK17282.1 putative mechanosensitive ion channel family protein [Clostridium ljungdahlii DSM 13528]AGY76322.1 mechanosensitive ion channel family protein [Clostridium autoethanogenum DSM 10061]ALU36484.1 MscS Mechanosensitive ion channel [Clostridium autoethanogenum DSM 10061]OAA84149.1 putative MscS family protein YkuT [Clostridium ljungdahlii DSM 13528]OVY48945.1 putative MscS family protein YkuT [Clostridium autoethan